ncbi:S-adenosyl-L-methionine-dependent methyltransferase [Hyaloscypha finlandica]|nr:S-adenosyl-L-methionine-dependent methyltransferase [Hyaloscypha finlandica]
MATVTDPTFRSYSAEEAKLYSVSRLSYSQNVHNKVLDHHTTTGGNFDLLLDVGCGPGNATRDLSLSFDKTIGADPGAQMSKAANALGGKTKSRKSIKFMVATTEEISQIKGLEPGSVDLLTTTMAAHWFDMAKFWAKAAKVVKPGGTVALWICASSFTHLSTLNYEKVQQVLLRFERETLVPYELPGNRLSMDMYDNLPLPWNSEYVKYDYDREGVLSNGVDFFGGGSFTTLDKESKDLSTASIVTRWRATNPELVGTDKDAVKVFIGELKEVLGGQDWILRGMGTAILLFKKSA